MWRRTAHTGNVHIDRGIAMVTGCIDNRTRVLHGRIDVRYSATGGRILVGR